MTEVITPVQVPEPGKAMIKSEFLQSLPVKPVEAVAQQHHESSNLGPPPKKKARGQNKSRPQTARDKKEICLCPSLVNDDGVCLYGDKCRFIHDIEKYMAIKPDDISPTCYMYSTHGKCHYGLACRFGSCHIRKNEDGSYQSVVDEGKVSSNPTPKVINQFPRELRVSLRKKTYVFRKSNELFGKKGNQSKTKAADSKSELCPSVVQNSSTNENSTIPELNQGQQDVDITKSTSDPDHQLQGIMGEKQISETSKPNKPELSIESVESKENVVVSHAGSVTDEDFIPSNLNEKRTFSFAGKLFLAPLTTVGNLPFRVVCKSLGADITCGEMAMSNCLLQGNVSEWALMKRHPCEDMFGVQICGSFPDTMARCAELIENQCDVDFIDVNMGCPIDLVFNKGAGSALMQRTKRLFDIVESMKKVMTIPLTCKMRTGVDTKKNTAHLILPKLREYGVSLCTVHGRSRQARYTKLADWDYVKSCAQSAAPMPLFGNGDILSFEDYNLAVESGDVSGVMIARGALIKPWIFTEIKEQRHWDISSSERFDILKQFTNQGLLHWGSDSRGVETTRRFLLEWLSFLQRYIPVGILERAPQKINEKPPLYVGRDDLETLMSDRNCKSWVKISEMLLGKVPDGFQFLPKHKANSYN